MLRTCLALALALGFSGCDGVSRLLSGAEETVPTWRPMAGSHRHAPDQDLAACQGLFPKDPASSDACMLSRGYEKLP